MDKTQPYHHGNLEQVLIEEATRMIGESGAEQLSMRGLAERVGVSRTAAYHHFKNKNELLCAIAEQGFYGWEKHFDALFNTKPIPLKPWLSDFVQTYIAFAQDHAEQYDLMFGRPVWKRGAPTQSLNAVSKKAFQRFVAFIREWQQQGIFTRSIDGLRLAQVTWGMLHGMCRLLNDGVYLEGEAVEGMCNAIVKVLANSIVSVPDFSGTTG